ncbi:group II intron reverse transcriptase/maturase [Rhodanobacter denitrificans]|uniref:Retron-type reverse transcriptase n=1 Tax=Rhodanobacter denitrificans TaxID=666685 RepID=M4NS56_9GAMM|nr:group II intron reverse transcriptase/maturase [Rhodanobacter denitrificans]AGG90376.1 Retron-type reverse transcriptase [Rhodanobacter denitrificans]UJJ57343.1 group II intron reverse transcriptase/maturase [Rhodanobacter denitrificans]UJJ57344.1 group II intron reverse transcriptase/maturase [Rhodanobacter denitrificans]UJM85763.1 group II intron reverse transcriptase/maturase [Rhodanobacter denitrificans]
MDANTLGDVASARWNQWHTIPWAEAFQHVRRLQARIAKAAKDENWRTVKRLQKLLVRSTTARAVAVRRVTENQGRKTPGVDGLTWSTPKEKWKAISALDSRGYRPKPLRRIHIPKASGGKRPLGIPTMKDRTMQALHWLALDPVAETRGDLNSYGFRSGRSTADAIAQCHNALSREHSPQWVLEGDIKACFDNISHDWLVRNVPMDRRLLEKWLKAGFVEGRKLFPTDAGTPQGGIISPCLANLALDGMDRLLKDSLPRRDKVNFIRYADDFVVTAISKEVLEAKVKPLIVGFLSERGLTLSEKKTKITHVTEGFDFLGWHVQKHKQFLNIVPSKRNATAFYAKVRDRLRELRGARQDDVVFALNPILRGWANYHQIVHASRTFAKLDYQVTRALWRWATRRHPMKGKRWIKRRYFRRDDSRDWLFRTDVSSLIHLAKVPVVRHVKVRSDTNPYDPKDEAYFDERLTRRMRSTLQGRRRLYWLWNRQEGICPICSAKITKATGWNVHHVVWRVYGGSDKLSNLQLLHPTCHKQLHARGAKG